MEGTNQMEKVVAEKKAPKKLDWSTESTEADYEAIVGHYNYLGGSVMSRFRFVPVMQSVRPDALKRYRLIVNSVTDGVGLRDPLPNPPYISFIIAQFYCTLPYPQGFIADLEAARKQGAKKSEVADMMALGWLHAGPFGMNVVCTAAEDYLNAWDANDGAPGLTWPKGWSVDRSVFECGIDFTNQTDENEISAEDLAKIEAWHLKWEGEVPTYVSFLAKHYPLALRTFRARYENAMGGNLPKELYALCKVHLSASWMKQDALRRALHMARRLGVSKDHVVQLLTLVQQYRGDIAMDSAIAGADEILSEW